MEKPESLRRKTRRENLNLLIKEAGGPTQVALETGTPKSHFSALTAKKRGIGDELAAKLETIYGKEPGWMDKDHSAETLIQVDDTAKVREMMARGIQRLLNGVPDDKLGAAMASIQAALEEFYVDPPRQ